MAGDECSKNATSLTLISVLQYPHQLNASGFLFDHACSATRFQVTPPSSPERLMHKAEEDEAHDEASSLSSSLCATRRTRSPRRVMRVESENALAASISMYGGQFA